MRACRTRVSADKGAEGHHRQRPFIGDLDQHLASGKDTPSAPLSQADREELQHLKERLASLASQASAKRVRLLIDAEESEIQPVRSNSAALHASSHTHAFRRSTMLPCPSWTRSTDLTHGCGTPINAIFRTPDRVCCVTWSTCDRMAVPSV